MLEKRALRVRRPAGEAHPLRRRRPHRGRARAVERRLQHAVRPPRAPWWCTSATTSPTTCCTSRASTAWRCPRPSSPAAVAARAACPCRPGARLCKPQGARSVKEHSYVRLFRPSLASQRWAVKEARVPRFSGAPRDTNVSFKGKETEHAYQSQRSSVPAACSTSPPRRSSYLHQALQELQGPEAAPAPRTATSRARTSCCCSRRPPRAPAAPSRSAAMDLGMGVTYLDPGSSQMGKKESIEDTARVLGRFYDGIEYRGFAQTDRGGSGRERRRAGVERSDHRVASHPDARRHPHRARRTSTTDIKGMTLVFMGDAAQQRGQLAHGRVRQARHALRGLRPEGAHARRPSSWRPARTSPPRTAATVTLHRRREGGLHGRRRHLHRHLGVHGRAGRGVGRAHQASRERSA